MSASNTEDFGSSHDQVISMTENTVLQELSCHMPGVVSLLGPAGLIEVCPYTVIE